MLPESRARSGFTLIEVILTIALISLLSTMFVLNIQSLFRRTELQTMESQYWKAVESARSHSVFNQRAYYLRWDEKGRSFVVESGEEKKRFDVEGEALDELEIEVLFEEIAPENSYVLIRGELVAKREIAQVGFFPDGTCSPYTVSMKIGDYESFFKMDPWTGVELVDASESKS